MKSSKLRLMMKAKKKPDAKKPMTVDGSAARPRLDRPGRMKRAEGGRTEWTGEYDSGKKLREESAAAAKEADRNNYSAFPLAIGGGMMAGASSIKGKLAGAALTALGAIPAAKMIKNDVRAHRLSREADKQEGRKSGGSVKE